MPKEDSRLDIIVPVYNEGENIVSVLESLESLVKTPFRVLICYDHDDDNTLPVVQRFEERMTVVYVKNQGIGAHGAVVTGFKESNTSSLIVLPADDPYNAKILDEMYHKFEEGCDVVVASRFMEGGCMEGCPFIKSVLVRAASFSLYWLSSIPVRDASNGFRLFSRKLLKEGRANDISGALAGLKQFEKRNLARPRWR